MLFQEFPTTAFPRFAGASSAFPDRGVPPIPQPGPGGPRVAETCPAILIVEDDRVSRQTLAMLLKSSGYPAAVAGSAEEALRLVERDGPPRLALVDLNLPGMD